MKRFNKVLAFLMVAEVMLFSATGCGTQANTEKSGDSSKQAVEQKSAKEIGAIKIGFVNEMTGAMASQGGLSVYNGERVAIDLINEKGGIMGRYKVNPIYADDKSDIKLAISEAERLIKEEKVPILSGGFPSAFGVAISEVSEKNQTIYWTQTASTDSLIKGKNNKYVFRVQSMGSDWGKTGVDFINGNMKKLGVSKASDLKVAILNEDSAYGTLVSQGNISQLSTYGMKIVSQQSYNKATITDFKPIVAKLIESKPDVLFHTAYLKDCTLFMNAAKELGFKPKMIVGHGAAYGNFESLTKEVGKDITNYLIDSEPTSLELIDKSKLVPEAYELNQKALKTLKDKYNDTNPSGYFSLAFVNTYLLLDKVIPLAIEKYGEVTAESVRKAALEIDIPEKSLGLGYGVKFAPPGDEYAGQNIKAFACAMQYANGKSSIVWPDSFKTIEPVIPFSKDSFFGQ